MILLVGTADNYLIEKAKEYSDNPILVTEENWQDEIEVGYTGIEEFNNKICLLKLLHRADKIIYFPKDTNEPFDLSEPTKNPRGHLENLLLFVNQNKTITNLKEQILGNSTISKNASNFLELSSIRKSNNAQLWAAGCSYTYGTGVTSEESYPSLLSDMLDTPVSNLAEPGSSIAWSADQILRSDIKKDDIIVWGLTNKHRINWWTGWTDTAHNNISISAYPLYKDLEKHFPKKLLLDSDNCLYQLLTHIHQVINFCQKAEAKLLLVGLLTSNEDLLYLHNLPNYYHYYNKNSFNFLDYGSDNDHPGPLQHQDYARAIHEQLQLRSWI